jgi:hypothetical protein
MVSCSSLGSGSVGTGQRLFSFSPIGLFLHQLLFCPLFGVTLGAAPTGVSLDLGVFAHEPLWLYTAAEEGADFESAIFAVDVPVLTALPVDCHFSPPLFWS